MKNQKIAIATIVTAVLILGMDFLFYGIILNSPGAGECCMKEAPDMMWMILGDLFFGLAFVVIYDKTAGNGSKINMGIMHGLWITILCSVAMGFVWYSLMDMEMQATLGDMVYSLVKYCILGVIVAHLVTSSDGSRGKDTGSGEVDPTRTGGGGLRGKDTGSGERGKTTGSGE